MMKEKYTDSVMSSGTPTEEEIQRWEKLSRPEQLAKWREDIDQALDGNFSYVSPEVVKQRAFREAKNTSP